MKQKKLIAIILSIIIINLSLFIINEFFLNVGINYSENEVIFGGHELGSHGICHANTEDFSYKQGLDWAKQSLELIEDNTKSTSRWGATCLSLAYPYSRANEDVMKAAYDVGFRIAGASRYDPSLIINETSTAKNQLDWMNIRRLGEKVTLNEADINRLYQAEQTGALADCMYHQDDKLDREFLEHIDSNDTVWHATWGEVRSYYYLINHTTVYYNSLESNDTEIVFDLNYSGSDTRIWDVPITLEFDLEQNFFRNLSIINRLDNKDYQYVENISTVQQMREGYKYEPDTEILYVSIKPKDKRIIINGSFLSENQEGNIFIGFSRWWNGLSWAVTIHVDDVKDVSKVLGNYKDYKQPLTLMIMGEKIENTVLIIIALISLLILIPVIALFIYRYKKDL
jgi:hypothetical protein